jgi:hypothetical protein
VGDLRSSQEFDVEQGWYLLAAARNVVPTLRLSEGGMCRNVDRYQDPVSLT